MALPPGYRLSKGDSSWSLYAGDREIGTYPMETDLKTIEADAVAHAASTRPNSLPHDPVTGLPSSSSLLPSAASLAQVQVVQVVCLQIHGLVEVESVYGERAAHLLLRQLARRLQSLLDPHDLMGRHRATSLLIFTVRAAGELPDLVTSIHRLVKAVAILTRGRPLPEGRVGVATVRRASEERDALAAIEAAVSIAEEAAIQPGAEGPITGLKTEAVPLQESIGPIEGPREVPETTPSWAPHEPLAARPSPAPVPGEPAIGIRRIGIALEGSLATAMITLSLGSRVADGEATGRNTTEGRLAVLGEVTAMAVTMLLPRGYSVSLVSIGLISYEGIMQGRAVMEIAGPDRTEQVSAVVPVQATTYSTAVRAALRAVEPRVREILRLTPPAED